MLTWLQCRDELRRRLEEPSPSRLQLISGPRQVGKTTLLLDLARSLGDRALYVPMDGPEAARPGAFERLWMDAEQVARARGSSVVLLDEVHALHDWGQRVKGEWDRVLRLRLPVRVVATGSSSLRLGAGSRDSLAGRFERLTLAHWEAAATAATFGLEPLAAAEAHVRFGSYPGGVELRGDPARLQAYVRDSIVEPALTRDVAAVASVRRPALLRQLFWLCAAMPAQIVSLQKLGACVPDGAALETLASYLGLLEEAFLVAPLEKYAARVLRRRAAPPKLIVLNNALLAAADPRGSPDRASEPDRFGAWVENACLAHAWNVGQHVSYWRQEPLEVDAVVQGTWGSWALEVKTGRVEPSDLNGLLELTSRHRDLRPLLVAGAEGRMAAERCCVTWVDWRTFLLEGPPRPGTERRSPASEPASPPR